MVNVILSKKLSVKETDIHKILLYLFKNFWELLLQMKNILKSPNKITKNISITLILYNLFSIIFNYFYFNLIDILIFKFYFIGKINFQL
jgi:hypothetical protein